MPFVRVNGVVLHHQVSGPADKPAIVFSNSLGTDFRIWSVVAERLRAGYRIVRYDKRGHGLSQETPAPYKMGDHVSDLSALLDHLGIRRAAVVGLSVGGQIAMALTAKRPELVKALVICDSAHKIGTDELWNTRIEAVKTNGISSIADAVMQRWFTPEYRSPDNPDFEGYRAMLTRTGIDGHAGTCAALRDSDLTETARAFKLPVMLMVGDQDGATPPDLVKSTADLIKGSEYHVIPGSGHLPCIEKPEAVADLIAAFLKKNGYV